MITVKELALKLNGLEYPPSIKHDLQIDARKAGLVIVYGESDDLMEFEGGISDEIGAYGGHTARVTREGLHNNQCSEGDECPHFDSKKGVEITSIWSPVDLPGASWLITTEIPHETFDIMEDGQLFCRGIVFALADVPMPRIGPTGDADPITEIEALRQQLAQARADRADLLDTVAQFLRGECTCVRQYQEDVEGLQHFPGCPVVMQRQLAEVTEQRDGLAEALHAVYGMWGSDNPMPEAFLDASLIAKAALAQLNGEEGK